MADEPKKQTPPGGPAPESPERVRLKACQQSLSAIKPEMQALEDKVVTHLNEFKYRGAKRALDDLRRAARNLDLFRDG